LYSITGTKISSNIPKVSFGIWWDGDLLREFIGNISYSTTTKTGLGGIFKWDYASSTFANILSADGTLTRDDKGNPVLQADLLGDWREELIYGLEDSSALRIYTTTDVSSHRFHTLMHDPVYRLGVAWQNVGYNMPPQTSFYLGDGMEQPPAPNIYTVNTVSVEFEPKTLNVKSNGNRIKASIELPLGYDVSFIQPSSVKLLVVENGRVIDSVGELTGKDEEATVKFDRGKLIDALQDSRGDVELRVTGSFRDGNRFTGAGSIHVIH
jgi:hypothetical protein